MLLLQDDKGRWKTQFKADSFKRASGEEVKSEEIKNIIFSVGDSVVTKQSLVAESQRSALPITEELYQCVGGPPPTDCSVYLDRTSCNADPACTWDGKAKMCVNR